MLDDFDLLALIDPYIVSWCVNIALAILIFLLGRIAVRALVMILVRFLQRAGVADILTNFVGSIARTALLLVVVIASLNQLGIDTTSLIALVGAAGLAVGLALQNSLQNFAAGVMLIVFRPFKAGDFVEAAGTAGTVEMIGIFSSTLRTGDNTEMIIPNGAIYGGTIINFSARQTRRVDMTFRISYDDDLRRAKDLLSEILNSDDRILKDPPPLVAVSELAESSVNLVVRPWVNAIDYSAVLWDTNEKVKLVFDENGLSIPCQRLNVVLPSEHP